MKCVAREMEEEGAMGSQGAFSEAKMKAIIGVVGNLLEKALKEVKKDSYVYSEDPTSNWPSGTQAGSTQGEGCTVGRKRVQGCVRREASAQSGSLAVGGREKGKDLVGVQKSEAKV